MANTSGVIFSPQSAKRISNAVRKVEAGFNPPGLNSPHGVPDRGFWAKITGHHVSAGVREYDWAEVLPVTLSTDPSGFQVLAGGRTSTSTTRAINDAEINGMGGAAVANGVIVWLSYSYDPVNSTPCYRFEEVARIILAEIVCFGPEGQGDFSDNRYWAEIVAIANTDGDDSSVLTFGVDASSTVIVPVTNLFEQNRRTHKVPPRTIVVIKQSADQNNLIRWIMECADQNPNGFSCNAGTCQYIWDCVYDPIGMAYGSVTQRTASCGCSGIDGWHQTGPCTMSYYHCANTCVVNADCEDGWPDAPDKTTIPDYPAAPSGCGTGTVKHCSFLWDIKWNDSTSSWDITESAGSNVCYCIGPGPSGTGIMRQVDTCEYQWLYCSTTSCTVNSNCTTWPLPGQPGYPDTSALTPCTPPCPPCITITYGGVQFNLTLTGEKDWTGGDFEIVYNPTLSRWEFYVVGDPTPPKNYLDTTSPCPPMGSGDFQNIKPCDTGTGLTGNYTIVTDFDSDTCEITTKVFHFVNGDLVSVTDS